MCLAEDIHVAVIGAGSLGSELCARLVEHRVRRVTVIDPDCLQNRNIPLSRLYLDTASQARDGMAKVDAIHQYANRAGLTNWQVHVMEVADVGASALDNIDLFLSCTDNTLARVETQRLAYLLGVPLVDGGLYGVAGTGGRATLFAPVPQAACYLCGISEHRRAELLAFALSASLGCALPPDEEVSLGEAAASAGNVARAMLRLAEQASVADHSFALRLTDGSEEQIMLKQSATCLWHRPIDRLHLLTLPHDEPLRNYLRQHPDTRLQLEWPICLHGRCGQCGFEQPVLRRLAWTRRSFPCAQCASVGTVQPLRVVESIGIHDAEADWTPRQLGLPAKHLFQCRKPLEFSAAHFSQEME